MVRLSKLISLRPLELPRSLKGLAAKVTAAGVVGTAGLVAASADTPSVFAQSPTPADAFQIFTDPTVVPSSIVHQAFDRGVARGPLSFRTQGVKEDHNIFSPIQHPGRIMDRVVEGLNAIGIPTDAPSGATYDWLKPLTAALLLAGISAIIMRDYSRRPLVGGRTTLEESIGLTGALGMLGMVGWLYTAPYTISALLRDGFVASSFRSNYGAATANFLVMGMWAFLGAWSLASSLTFRLPGPAFKHLFMRDRTQHAPFMLVGKKLVEATGDNVAALMAQSGGKITVKVEASHLQSSAASVQDALQALGTTPVTLTLEVPHEEFLTLRDIVAAHTDPDNGITATVTIKTIQNLKNKRLAGDPKDTTTTVIAGSRLADHDDLKSLIENDRAYVQSQGQNRPSFVILKKDIPLKDLPKDGVTVVAGSLRHEDTHTTLPQKLPRDGEYVIEFKGPANTMVSAVADAIANRPLIRGLNPRALLLSPANVVIRGGARQALHRVVWPTNATLSFDVANATPATYEAIATVAGQKRYVVQPKPPQVAISRAVIDSIVADQTSNGVADPQRVTLLIKPSDLERHRDALTGVFGDLSSTASPDYPSHVRVPVHSGALITALSQNEFLTLVRGDKVALEAPAPLALPREVANLSPHESIAVKVDPGDTTPLKELQYPSQAGTGPAWWHPLRRAVWAGPQFGRLPAISAITVAGAPISAPITITTKALTGYTDPATWMISGARVLLSGFINMVFTPGMRGLVSPHRFNNYLAFLPGLLVLSVIYEPLNDVYNNEPPKMWVRGLIEDNAHEDRPAKRRNQLLAMQKELADITTPEGRAFVLNYLLGNFLPAGFYTADDLKVLKTLYEKLQDQDDPDMARARLLAGMMNDPGLVYMLSRNPDMQSFFAREARAHGAKIRRVITEMNIPVDPATLFARLDPQAR